MPRHRPRWPSSTCRTPFCRPRTGRRPLATCRAGLSPRRTLSIRSRPTLRPYRTRCAKAAPTYESNEEMLAKVIGGNSGWDVVFPTHNRLEPMRANGLLAPLRHEWLPGLPHLDARFRAPAWDAALQWGLPYMWNGTGIVYNRTLHPPPARWADLWSPSLKGRLTMLDDPEDMLGACLKKLGLPFSATDPAQLARAERE